jgi:hypothetical protein
MAAAWAGTQGLAVVVRVPLLLSPSLHHSQLNGFSLRAGQQSRLP